MKRTIGRTGISVHPIGYGAWPLSNVNRPSEEQALEVIARAVEAGVDLIDTADAYCLDEHDFGHNEQLIRKALDAIGDRGEVTVATKMGSLRPGGAWTRCGRPEHIKNACDGSLQRLGVETITLYQLHAPDENVPIEESVGAMRDLQEAGKVAHLGMSNFDLDQLERAQREARIESLQNQCNPWVRGDVDSGLVERCREMDVTYIAWYPVGGEIGHRACASHPVLKALSAKYGASPYQLLLAWLLGLGDHVLPIPGATRPASIQDSAKAADLKVEPADLEAIGALA